MKAKSKLLILFFVVVLTYLIYDYNEGKKDEKRRAQFSKIKSGMSSADVVNILGKPDMVSYSFDSSIYTFEYFIEEYESIGKSGMPSIVFDSSGKVGFTSFGD